MAQSTILIATPDQEIRNELITRLEGGGYSVVATGQVDVLREKAIQDDTKLVLLGMGFVDLDYQEFIANLTSSELGYVPVVMIATSDKLDKLHTYLQWGANDHITPPFLTPLLSARIDTCLGKRFLDASQASEELDLAHLLKFSYNMRHHVLPVGVALTEEKDINQLTERIVQEAQKLCNADGGTLYLVTEDNRLEFLIMNTLSLNVARGGTSGEEVNIPPLNMYDPETGEPNHHNVATCAATRDLSVNVPDVYHAKELDFSATKIFDANNNYRTVSCLAIPMKNSSGAVIGVLQLLNSTDQRSGEIVPFGPDDQLLAESLAIQAAIAINNLLLLKHEQQLAKLETDVQIGRTVQKSFLPHTLPKVNRWEIAARFHPAREVAGDFYDAFEVRRNVIGLVMADVCDKGVPAAIYMALARSMIRAFARQNYHMSWADNLFEDDGGKQAEGKKAPDFQSVPLKEGLTRANNYLVDNHNDLAMFVTVFFGLLNTKTGKLLYVNAGHNPPFIINSNGTKTPLEPTAPIVGVFRDMALNVQSIQLEPGDTLFTFTDGVPDAHSPEGEKYSDARLEALLDSNKFVSAEALLDDIETALWEHMDDAVQFDDITMMAIHNLPK